MHTTWKMKLLGIPAAVAHNHARSAHGHAHRPKLSCQLLNFALFPENHANAKGRDNKSPATHLGMGAYTPAMQRTSLIAGLAHTNTHTHTHTKAPLTFEDVLLACIAQLLDRVQNESSRLGDARPRASNRNTPRLLIHIDVAGRHRLRR